MQEIILFNKITPTKSNIEVVAAALIERVKNGEMNPVEFAINAKFVEEALAKARKEILYDVVDEVQKNGKEITLLGAKVEVAESGIKYDYSQDEKWCEIKDRMKPLEDLLNEQQEKIKMATKIGADSVDTDSGEVVARKVIRTSTTAPKVTLGK